MGYVDPKEGGAISNAIKWAEDHGFISEHPTLEALIQALTTIAPHCDSGALRAYMSEYGAPEDVGLFVLALAPPFEPLSAGAWRAGHISSPDHPPAMALVGICEPETLAQLRRGAR